MPWSTALVPLFASSTFAYVFQPDSTGAPQRVSSDVPYVVNANSPDISYEQVLPAIHAAFASWSNASQGRLSFTDQGTTQLGPPAEGDNRLGVPVTISWEQNQWSYEGDNQAVAILVEDVGTHVIVRADIVFNGVTHNWANLTDGQAHPGADDVQNTMTHEVGHLVGFGHPPDTTSAMFPSTYPGDLSRRTLDANDVGGIDALYAAPSANPGQALGCSSGGGGFSSALVLLLVVVLLSRNQRPA
jgi:uncharacterized protein (TIGR03382 family)